MSVYIQKVYEIIDEFDDENKKELCNHYFSVWKHKLESINTVNSLCIAVLSDLKLMFNKYSFLDEEKFVELEVLTLKRKILEIRAGILDLVDTDYSDNIENVYKPEKWMFEIISELKTYFNFSEEGQIPLLKDFTDIFLEELCLIFLSQNKRFGKSGNQLVLNFLLYKFFVKKVTSYEFSNFFAKFVGSFEKDAFKGFDALEGLLGSYLDANQSRLAL